MQVFADFDANIVTLDGTGQRGRRKSKLVGKPGDGLGALDLARREHLGARTLPGRTGSK
jgi:hypothetical protein